MTAPLAKMTKKSWKMGIFSSPRSMVAVIRKAEDLGTATGVAREVTCTGPGTPPSGALRFTSAWKAVVRQPWALGPLRAVAMADDVASLVYSTVERAWVPTPRM